MNKHLTLLLFIFGLSFQVFSQDKFDPDRNLQELIGKKQNIGMSSAYSIAGKIEWSGSAGYSCAEKETPFTTNTFTRIASIAKSFTAVAVMQLVEEVPVFRNWMRCQTSG